MYYCLKLKKEVSETTAYIEPNDVLSVKNKLKSLGYYKEPSYGMSKITDSQMFDGIKKFQKDIIGQTAGVGLFGRGSNRALARASTSVVLGQAVDTVYNKASNK